MEQKRKKIRYVKLKLVQKASERCVLGCVQLIPIDEITSNSKNRLCSLDCVFN